MLRRLASLFIGLAVAFPAFAASAQPALGHGANAFTYQYTTIAAGGGTFVVGQVTNHTASRYATILMTATWRDGSTVMATESASALLAGIAPHATSPFVLFEDDVEVDAGWTLSLVAAGTVTTAKPVGGLLVTAGDFTGADTYEGTITNHGDVAATNVVVHANRADDGLITGAGSSATIPTIAPDATVGFTIAFDPSGSGQAITNLVARTTSGAFLTSWNNYFGDLGSSLFTEEIAWLAEQGITNGCGAAVYCPKSTVTRAQMAVFLATALELPPADDPHPFTDIDGSFAEDAIAAIWDAGITTGCSPTTFCPSSKVSREQMAAFLDRGYDFPESEVDFFTDDTFSFAEQSINDLASAGVTGGCSATAFCPKSGVTREQMAAFIYRAEP